MASTHVHPRRRGVKATSPQMTPLDTQNLLPKAGTFHSPSSTDSELCNPIVNAAFMPQRSSTSVDTLEELLNDAGVRRVTNLIEQFDRTFAGRSSNSEGSILSDRDVLPVPSFVLDHTSLDEDVMDIEPKVSPIDHHHASDSGIGSSVEGSGYEEPIALRSSTRRSVASSVSSGFSAVNRSFSGLGSKNGNELTLGRRAIKLIEDNILKPILAEAALKEFHPLIADVPHRIGNKDISNLRDLEKTLIFLAPNYSASPESYQSFCERSIQCIHTTVEYLHEREQRLPTDRPYTNNYFLDLMEQIRRYASIMAATRNKQENGEELDEMDYSPEERITLRGGLSHNGRPAELVREKDGKVIPIAEENQVDEAFVERFNQTKRTLDDDSDMDDDEVMRSMARRRKSEKPGDVVHHCPSCEKEFKRPCDLTKHKKTHSRPFKCPEPKCKYHDMGWPTEKERDRHVNDKHSASPPQYKCLYHGCVYVSKRESNCKQHMEKTHGYVYIRSKSNGRTKKGSGSIQSPNTPMTPLVPTPPSGQAQSLDTPITPFDAFPASPALGAPGYPYNTTPMSMQQDWNNPYRRDSNTTAGTYNTGSSSNFVSPLQNVVGYDDHSPASNAFFADPGFANAFNQQPTPEFDFNNVDFNSTLPTTGQHLSPNAQPDLTLYSPADNQGMPWDEGLDLQGDFEGFGTFPQPNGDFQLFDNATGGGAEMTQAALFEDFSNMGAHLGDFNNDLNFDDNVQL